MIKQNKAKSFMATVEVLGLLPVAFLSASAAHAADRCSTVLVGLGPDRHIEATCSVGQEISEQQFLDDNLAVLEMTGFLGAGNDTLTVNGGKVFNAPGAVALQPGVVLPFKPGDGAINFLAGDDTVTMSGGFIGDTDARVVVYLDTDDNTFVSTGGTIVGNDMFDMSGGSLFGDVYGGAGSDTFVLSGGTVAGDLLGGSGGDVFTISGGSLVGNVDGGAGFDTFTLSGGSMSGNITAEDVTLSGGTFMGNVAGLDEGSLAISGDTLKLGANAAFSGSFAKATLSDVDLQADGFSQHFDGFNLVELTGSKVLFTENQRIDSLILSDKSTLFVHGMQTIGSQYEGLGTLALDGSTVDMINDDPTDRLTVGGLSIKNSTIMVDYDQSNAAIDAIVVNPVSGSGVTASGDNRIFVKLLGTPELGKATDVTVIQSPGTIDSSLFTIDGITGTPSSLYSYDLMRSDDGSLLLRATPTESPVGIPAPTSNASIGSNSINQLNDVTSTNVAGSLGLTGGASSGGAPPFGVFSSGQLARSHYDGFDVVGSSVSTPSYAATEFSTAVSVDWNASEYFGFDNQYGLNIGAFGGYATSSIDLGSYLDFSSAGSAFNRSGLFGSYGLFRFDRNYVIISGIGLFGNTDVTNGLLAGATGSYDTRGVAITASAGHIFAIDERIRFDLRGGVLGAKFTGDAFTDSLGVDYGKSSVSFGGVKFEPGIYADFAMANGMVASPYLRTEFLQLFGYKNKSSAGGQQFKFDAALFSAAVSAGVNVKLSKSMTLTGEVKGKLSADSNSIAGKLGVKVSF